MWRDIAVANRENLLRALGDFVDDLERFRRLLKAGNEKAVARFFKQAKERRDRWAQDARSNSPE